MKGSLQKGEIIDVEHVTLGGLRGDSVELDIVDLLPDAERVDCRLFLKSTRFDAQDWRIARSPVGDEEDFVGHFRSVTKLGSESIVDHPSDSKTGICSAT